MQARALVIMACLTLACGAPRSEVADELASVPAGPESLFASDAVVLSDSAIARILRYDLTLPPTVRIATLQLGGRQSYFRFGTTSAAVELGDSLRPFLARPARRE